MGRTGALSTKSDFDKPPKRLPTRLKPLNKARREVGRNKFLKKSGMPDKHKSFRKSRSEQELVESPAWLC